MGSCTHFSRVMECLGRPPFGCKGFPKIDYREKGSLIPTSLLENLVALKREPWYLGKYCSPSKWEMHSEGFSKLGLPPSMGPF